MDRRRRFEAPAGGVGEPAVDKRRLRRAVLDDARRRVERALAAAEAGDELAVAAEAILKTAADAPATPELNALGAALVRYRRARGG